jgi:hypothetical protein
MKPDSPLYSVLCQKRSGVEIVFSTGLTAADADLLVTKLAAIKCAARTAPMVAGDAPGMTRRSRSAAAPDDRSRKRCAANS